MRKALSLTPGIGFFIYLVSTLDEIKISSLLGILALSIVIGAMGYFFINSPNGRRSSETAFGIKGKYIFPDYGTIIPTKIFVGIIGAILLTGLGAFGFSIYGY